MKFCNKCKTEKEDKEFHNLYRREVVRLQSKCKPCHRLWTIENREKINATQRDWHWANRERSNSRSKNYWLRKVERTPKWLTHGDKIELRWAKQIAVDLTRETGIKYEVDHVIPLYGKNVSGLNVPWNIQVVESSVNKMKGNRHVE